MPHDHFPIASPKPLVVVPSPRQSPHSQPRTPSNQSTSSNPPLHQSKSPPPSRNCIRFDAHPRGKPKPPRTYNLPDCLSQAWSQDSESALGQTCHTYPSNIARRNGRRLLDHVIGFLSHFMTANPVKQGDHDMVDVSGSCAVG